jgi:energy-coupling factor transport system ATP-binding protein
MGGNGSGKTTLLKLLAGIIKQVMGSVSITGRVGYLPQHVQDYFRYDKVSMELESVPEDWITGFNLTHLTQTHPLDLSCGEAQKCALLSILSGKTDILALDEPTKGMDPVSKGKFGKLLSGIKPTAVIATHDMEFAALYSDRCAMLFDGEIVFTHNPREFFSGNKYYTTAIHKALSHIDKNAVYLSDVFPLWGLIK